MNRKPEKKNNSNKNPNKVTIWRGSLYDWLMGKDALPALLVFTILMYLRIFGNELTTRDDLDYIISNPYIKSLDLANIKAIFSSYYMGHYHPLTLLLYCFGYQIGGYQPWPYHLISLTLHSCNIVLVYILIRNIMQIKGFLHYKLVALLTALLFGIHPLGVESVAWVSEIKNVLYTTFFLAALLQYLKYSTTRHWKAYIASLFLFLLALISKAVAVTLPLVFFTVDIYLKKDTFSWKAILEKVPFLTLSLLFGIIAVFDQSASSSISDNLVMESGGFFQRLTLASYGIINYLWKLVLPIRLNAFYEYPLAGSFLLSPAYFLYPIILLILGFFSLNRILKSSEYIFGTLFFLINILPVLQFIHVGGAMMAERYVYVPSIGIFFILVYVLIDLSDKKKIKLNRLAVIGVIYIVLLSGLTFQRIGVWKNNMTLWEDILTKGKYKPHSVAWFAKAGIANEQGQYSEAITYINKYIQSYPEYAPPYFRRAYSRLKLNDFHGTISDLDRAEELGDRNAELYINRGLAKYYQADYFDALLDLDKAISINDTSLMAFNVSAEIKIVLNDYQGALSDLSRAIALSPSSAEIFNNRGIARMNLNDLHGALTDFNLAIELNNQLLSAYQNRVDVFFSLSDFEGAVNDLTHIISIQETPFAYYYRCKAYFELGMKEKSCSDLQKAMEMGHVIIDEHLLKYCN